MLSFMMVVIFVAKGALRAGVRRCRGTLSGVSGRTIRCMENVPIIGTFNRDIFDFEGFGGSVSSCDR